MEKYTIGELKAESGIPKSDERIASMFYDWFCDTEVLGKRGRKCLEKLRELVLAKPYAFDDADEIDIKNNCPGVGDTYDVVRVWGKDGSLKYAIVPEENDGACSLLKGDEGEIIPFNDWDELVSAFAA